MKINKNTGHDEIRFNVLKNYFDELHKPIMHLFNLLFKQDFSLIP